MDRQRMLDRLNEPFEIIVIGGGASGLGSAVDAASRGYKTLLLEQGDFAQATSSRSSQLAHGGVRYLRDGQIGFVLEGLQERALMKEHAPHLVHPLAFVIPTENIIETLYYYAGLKLYDWLAGKKSFGKSTILSKDKLLKILPHMKDAKGGVCYYDGQFDDARLAIELAKTFVDLGGTAINYMPVQNFIKDDGRIVGVIAQDLETGRTYELSGKAVINATGAFTDQLLKLDDPTKAPMIAPSQGSHIVLDQSFYNSDFATLIPETPDGRVIFILPWHERVLIGTTDIPAPQVTTHPKPTLEEITYLLKHSSRYLMKSPQIANILSVFAGIRPLVKAEKGLTTASLSRDHQVLISPSQLITLIGGKWTTYRKMGEDTIDVAAKTASLPQVKSPTKDLKLHGEDEPLIKQLANGNLSLLEKLHPEIPCRPVDIIWAVRNEMARKLEDVLLRRTRSLYINAKATISVAPVAAAIMAKELGQDQNWIRNEVKSFTALASNYLPPSK